MTTPLNQIDCVLLDRDGVINFDSEDYIKHPDEWQPIPGALEAIARLQTVVDGGICTNQSGVGRGLYDLETLEAIHKKMDRTLAACGGYLPNVHYCPHLPEAGCHCRKPKPGLLEDAMKALGKKPASTLFAGDSARDLDAAVAAKCLPVLLLTGNGSSTAEKLETTPLTFKNLASLADAVIDSR